MWLLRSGGAHASGRASDIQSQPMSGIEEEEREHELYHTETFPLAGVSSSRLSGSPTRARSPAPPDYVNIDETMREEARKMLLAYQRPVLNMMKQIAGAANIEYHRIVKQEVTEEAVDYVFTRFKLNKKRREAQKRARQWFEDACKANIIYEPKEDVVRQFQIGVYLRLIKLDDDFYNLYVAKPQNPVLEPYTIVISTNVLKMVVDVYNILVGENVFAVNMQPIEDSQVSMTQAAELSKFNLSELRDIVENYGNNYLNKTFDSDEDNDGDRYSDSSETRETMRLIEEQSPRWLTSQSQLLFAGAPPNQTVKKYIKAFIHTNEQITEIEARMDAHISEASQLVYDVLSSRGGEDDIGDANTVREWMLSPDSQSTINGARVLFARIVANRFCLSNDLAPKQGYLQARYGRLRQQAAILLVNLRRLHYKDKQFTLDTAIPRRSYSIY